jgi:hypothetical protein
MVSGFGFVGSRVWGEEFRGLGFGFQLEVSGVGPGLYFQWLARDTLSLTLSMPLSLQDFQGLDFQGLGLRGLGLGLSSTLSMPLSLKGVWGKEFRGFGFVFFSA